jgi:hypothetical protein
MSDKFFGNVELLCGFEGSDGATSYTEESNSRAATFVGNAQIDTAQSRFGSSSLLLDGTGDLVSFADSADFSLSNNPFTIECAVRFAITPDATSRNWVTHYDAASSQRAWIWRYSASRLQFLYSSDGISATSLVTNWFPAASVWYHCAVSRAGADLRFFVDGALMATHNIGTASIHNSSTAIRIGAENATPANFWNGWIDEVRITVGVARYTAAFTPPRGPYSRGKRLGVLGEFSQPVVRLTA